MSRFHRKKKRKKFYRKKYRRPVNKIKVFFILLGLFFLMFILSIPIIYILFGNYVFAQILDANQLEINIHNAINKEREKYGLPELAWDEKLSDIARAHSKDMATRWYFSHDSPEGNTPTDRYRMAGYNCYYENAENIARQYADFDFIVVQEAVDGWMNSAGHRANILNPSFKREGIGIYINFLGDVYITQNFC